MLKDTYRALFDSLSPKEETSDRVLAAMEEAGREKIPALAPVKTSRYNFTPLLATVAAGVVVLSALIVYLTVTRPPLPSQPGAAPTGTYAYTPQEGSVSSVTAAATDGADDTRTSADPTSSPTSQTASGTQTATRTRSAATTPTDGEPTRTGNAYPPPSASASHTVSRSGNGSATALLPTRTGTETLPTSTAGNGTADPTAFTPNQLVWYLGEDNQVFATLLAEGGAREFTRFRAVDPRQAVISEPLFVYDDTVVALADSKNESSVRVFVYRIRSDGTVALSREFVQEGERLLYFFQFSDDGKMLIQLVTRFRKDSTLDSSLNAGGVRTPAVICYNHGEPGTGYRAEEENLLKATEEEGQTYLFMTSLTLSADEEPYSMLALYGEESDVVRSSSDSISTCVGRYMYTFAHGDGRWTLRQKTDLYPWLDHPVTMPTYNPDLNGYSTKANPFFPTVPTTPVIKWDQAGWL